MSTEAPNTTEDRSVATKKDRAAVIKQDGGKTDRSSESDGGGRAPRDRRRHPWAGRTSFVGEFQKLDLDAYENYSLTAQAADVSRALSATRLQPADIAALLSPEAQNSLELLAERSHHLTVQRFGRTIQMFAPLYLSNECINTCLYCGFSMKNKIPRRTLTLGEVRREAETLARRGFRHQLLVAGEHPKLISPAYLASCISTVSEISPYVQIEVQAEDEATYATLKQAGLNGVVIYQETYDRDAYQRLHVHGMKRDMSYRLDAPDRIARAHVKQIGLGVLLGLTKRWRHDVLAVTAHARYIQHHFWRANVTVSLPRLKSAAGDFKEPAKVSDQEYIQAICTLRLALPEAGIVLSTREPTKLRDGLVSLGVTHMSAGSSTEPGGYETPGRAQEQFSIADKRQPWAVAQAIAKHGYEPVWKDWEEGI